MELEFVHRHENGVDFVVGPSIEVAVDRKGAELIGMTLKRAGAEPVEVIWRNMFRQAPDDGLWRSHAPVLFPIVGGVHGNRSVATTGETVTFPGLHGFFRKSLVTFAGASRTADGLELRYVLKSDEATRAMYPWDFEVQVAFVVLADGVRQSITVRNDDSRPMPYQVGWHPGINLPLASGAKKDAHVRLPAGPVVRLFNDENCYLTGESAPFDTAGDFRFTEHDLQLTYMFDVSGVAPVDRVVEIFDADRAVGVRVGFPDYPHLGVWSDEGAPFICIEPWQGMDDRVDAEPFDRKFGMVMLAPGSRETRTAWIRVAG